MNKHKIDFSLAEKLAIVKALDALILADGAVHKGELDVLADLMYRIDFDSNFIVQARNIADVECMKILKAMPAQKKEVLSDIFQEMAVSDGFVHHKETEMIDNILFSIGVLQAQHS